MKVNTPLGVLEFSDSLTNYGYRSLDTSKALKKLGIQTYDGGREILWYRNREYQVVTEISCIKDKPHDFLYRCNCGYELRSGFDLESIRCHCCESLMEKTFVGEKLKIV
ncbi:hypothetical protein T23_18300 [Turicibacter faecis]|uniref:Uncharacterized protein n=1 Tax=Turicibacter faecis TaxID=2963365 RepID=A0ABN6ZLD0_9FIRM|nr:hypothetical protein T23_18300 [Turicibacter sp. TC023]